MPMFATILEDIAGQPGSDTTQIATTAASYTKAALYLRDVIGLDPATARVLDYGAGLGLGTRAIQKVFPNTESYEPFPGRAVQSPTYQKSSGIPSGVYDGVICLNVLNVLEQGLRDRVVRDIARVLAAGGTAIIGARGWSGDVASSTFVEMDPDDPHAGWLMRGTQRVYQKGFTRSELESYVASLWGGKVDTIAHLPTITKAGIAVTKR